MRWTPWRQAGFGSPGETFTADGEVVWSWRRDPGVKLLVRPMQRRWQKRPLTGESTKQLLKPLRGESRVVPAEPVVSTLVCFSLSHTRLRVRQAPGFPCALSYLERDNELAKSGQFMSRQRGRAREARRGNVVVEAAVD